MANKIADTSVSIIGHVRKQTADSYEAIASLSSALAMVMASAVKDDVSKDEAVNAVCDDIRSMFKQFHSDLLAKRAISKN